ncbi:MAG TPA: histidine kinase [Propionicimonas sp.]|uniref:sensor histidine kinase n=1 Tax=Propionicimonas sp. TaxID=1955623 RepID=UPI002F3FF143
MIVLALVLAAIAVVLAAACVVLSFAYRRARAALVLAQAARARVLDRQVLAAEAAVAAERIRILREMHDVIAHSLAIMIAQADGGSYIVADTAAARRAFLTIGETGRAALTDTRRILGMLRHGDSGPELSPVPDQAPLDELVDQARAAGLQVSLIRVGDAGPLPSGSRLALYRICQEALTNVLKHGGDGVRVVVALSWTASEVVLTVTDRGGTPYASANGVPEVDPAAEEPLAGLGLGLLGMRERAEIVGGTLEAGPTEDGFRVRACIPLATLTEEIELRG